MKKQLLVLGMASMFALSGCAGISKVDFAKFKEKVDALSEVKVQEVKVSGEYDGKKIKFSAKVGDAVDNALTLATLTKEDADKGALYTVALAEKKHAVYAVSEDSNLTYYTGLGFKVVDEKKNTTEWNSKGLLSSMKGENTKLSFSWKKA